MSELTKNEQDLLESYRDGPTIWDATSLLPTVWSLAERGLIQNTHPSRSLLYSLTDAGRQQLGAEPATHACPYTPCTYIGSDEQVDDHRAYTHTDEPQAGSNIRRNNPT